jgi:Tol biopolymer transport system component
MKRFSEITVLSILFFAIVGITFGRDSGAIISTTNAATKSGNQNLVKIVFMSGRDGNGQIYTMNSDGSEQCNLSKNNFFDGTPAWSPDGNRIIFTSNRDEKILQIFVMDADGSNVIQLTDENADHFDPSWSSDGKSIVYRVDINKGGLIKGQIYVMDADGSNKRHVSDSSSINGAPSWSPDGRFITYSSTINGENMQIYVMDANGSNKRNLSNNQNDDTNPAWSPDGKFIAFSEWNNEGQNIFTIEINRTNLQQLTTTGTDFHPHWQTVPKTRQQLSLCLN